jgi:hypothetical protein
MAKTPQDVINARIAAAAARALTEAAARRQAAAAGPPLPKELGGRGGPEPTRYGDWEKKGIASDF